MRSAYIYKAIMDVYILTRKIFKNKLKVVSVALALCNINTYINMALLR